MNTVRALIVGLFALFILIALGGPTQTHAGGASNNEEFRFKITWGQPINPTLRLTTIELASTPMRVATIASFRDEYRWVPEEKTFKFVPTDWITTTTWVSQTKSLYFEGDLASPSRIYRVDLKTTDGIAIYNSWGAYTCIPMEAEFSIRDGIGHLTVTNTTQLAVPLRIAQDPGQGIPWPWEKFPAGTTKTYSGETAGVYVVDDREMGWIPCFGFSWYQGPPTTATPTPSQTSTNTPTNTPVPPIATPTNTPTPIPPTATQQPTNTPTATATLSSGGQIAAMLVSNLSEREKVVCGVENLVWRCSTNDDSVVTWTHPGHRSTLYYWRGFDAPVIKSTPCSHFWDFETQWLTCDQRGSTIKANRIAYQPAPVTLPVVLSGFNIPAPTGTATSTSTPVPPTATPVSRRSLTSMKRLFPVTMKS